MFSKTSWIVDHRVDLTSSMNAGSPKCTRTENCRRCVRIDQVDLYCIYRNELGGGGCLPLPQLDVTSMLSH